MIKVENIETYGIGAAIRGMRNPLNSWSKSDSVGNEIGPTDLQLCKKLFHGGPEHRKFMRQITCSMDVIAPLYWWKQLDTYKYIVCDSCSTMHKLTCRDLSLDDFSWNETSKNNLLDTIAVLNELRWSYEDPVDPSIRREIFEAMVQLLPSSYMQRRTLTFNYETAFNMIRQRENHKLPEWHSFCATLRGLPYLQQIIGCDAE